MRGLWLIGAAFLIQSCGAQWHLKRAIAKDPDIVVSQPIIVDTTVITEIKVAKGLFQINRDTALFLEQDGVKTSINILHDTIWVETTCPPDTITVSKEILVPKVVYQEKLSNFDIVKLVIIVIIIISLITFFRRLIK